MKECKSNQIVLLQFVSSAKYRKMYRLFLLCLILPSCSAFMLWLSFPPFNWWWMAFFALVPLIVSLQSSPSILFKAASGFLFGSLFSFLMGFWVVDTLVQHYQTSLVVASLFVVLALVIPFGSLYSLFGICFAFIQKQSSFRFCLSVASLWVLFEYLKELIPFLIPWGTIGYATLHWKQFVQVGDIGGLYGICFVILVVNCCCSNLVQAVWILRKKSLRFKLIKRVFLNGSSILLIIMIPVIYGNYRLDQFQTRWRSLSDATKSRISLVQGNFNLKDRWSGFGFQNRLNRYLQLSEKKDEHGFRLIVWPETVLNSSGGTNQALFREIADRLETREILITGGLRKSKHSHVLYNSAYAISGKGKLLWYDKQILLPYAEYSPMNLQLGAYRQAPDKFERGSIAPVFNTGNHQLGISICFEVLYPYYIRRSVRQGAQVLINISNDSWFEQSSMPALHLQSSVMRSIETRRFLLRTSNSGISAIVSPTGVVMGNSSLGTQEVVQGTFMFLETRTFYVRFGDWVLIVAAIIIAAALFRIIFARI